jgi:nitric oxide synthase-interacting protein
MACKVCIFENIIAQKAEMEKQEKLLQLSKHKEKESIQEKEEKARQTLLDNFEKMQKPLVPMQSTTRNTVESEPESSSSKRLRIEYKEEGKVGSYIEQKKLKDEETIKQMASKGEKAPKSELSCYWIPSLQPVGPEKALEDVKKYVVCPVTDHPIQLKKLIPLVFKKTVENGKESLICPSCLKEFNNSMTILFPRKCGHCICKSCADRNKTKQCFVCDKSFSSKDIIKLHNEGTSFSSVGNVKVTTYTAAFQ